MGLFSGELSGNVYLNWVTKDEMSRWVSPGAGLLAGYTLIPGDWSFRGDPGSREGEEPVRYTPDGSIVGRRIRIGLNADVLALDARRDVKHLISALVHEKVVSVPTESMKGKDWD